MHLCCSARAQCITLAGDWGTSLSAYRSNIFFRQLSFLVSLCGKCGSCVSMWLHERGGKWGGYHKDKELASDAEYCVSAAEKKASAHVLTVASFPSVPMQVASLVPRSGPVEILIPEAATRPRTIPKANQEAAATAP